MGRFSFVQEEICLTLGISILADMSWGRSCLCNILVQEVFCISFQSSINIVRKWNSLTYSVQHTHTHAHTHTDPHKLKSMIRLDFVFFLRHHFSLSDLLFPRGFKELLSQKWLWLNVHVMSDHDFDHLFTSNYFVQKLKRCVIFLNGWANHSPVNRWVPEKVIPAWDVRIYHFKPDRSKKNSGPFPKTLLSAVA